ncbi:unnamed protein product [Cuscuta epithymum]|uniref:Mediator-associated protein 2 n=1 Tax=Cuscuta epithymum TaxID=186058 RepID=A0AAV0G9L0_9ASTE|nr:unnamed protein product [Cuscuta epithymum]
MGDAGELGYKPPPDFEEDKRDPLVVFNLTDSTELWLMQWPLNHAKDFDGQEVSLELNRDGNLGSFVSPSGKSYDVYSLKAQNPELTVFSSSSEAKVVGKFSRDVSFIHYPEPSEYQKKIKTGLKELAQRSSTITKTASTFHPSSATKSSKQKLLQSTSVYTASAPKSQHKSPSSKPAERPKSPTERSGGGHPTSADQSLQDSKRANSSITTSGSAGRSLEKKSKKVRNK